MPFTRCSQYCSAVLRMLNWASYTIAVEHSWSLGFSIGSILCKSVDGRIYSFLWLSFLTITDQLMFCDWQLFYTVPAIRGQTHAANPCSSVLIADYSLGKEGWEERNIILKQEFSLACFAGCFAIKRLCLKAREHAAWWCWGAFGDNKRTPRDTQNRRACAGEWLKWAGVVVPGIYLSNQAKN